MFVLNPSFFKGTRFELLKILNFIVRWMIHLLKLFWVYKKSLLFIDRLDMYVLLGFWGEGGGEALTIGKGQEGKLGVGWGRNPLSSELMEPPVQMCFPASLLHGDYSWESDFF